MTDEAKALVEALKQYTLTYAQRWKLVGLANRSQPFVYQINQERAGFGTSQRITGEGFKVLAGNGKNFVSIGAIRCAGITTHGGRIGLAGDTTTDRAHPVSGSIISDSARNSRAVFSMGGKGIVSNPFGKFLIGSIERRLSRAGLFTCQFHVRNYGLFF